MKLKFIPSLIAIITVILYSSISLASSSETQVKQIINQQNKDYKDTHANIYESQKVSTVNLNDIDEPSSLTEYIENFTKNGKKIQILSDGSDSDNQ